jgi:hypothetical protein
MDGALGLSRKIDDWALIIADVWLMQDYEAEFWQW